MDNAEKLVTLGTQDEGNQSKNTTQYVLDTIILSKTWTLIETTGGTSGSLDGNINKLHDINIDGVESVTVL
jgi:hypothetical protein